ncbi:hypothetical protein [Haloferula rosea]|uniref:ABC transporter ATP-binding protein n=1 Tax=Haloferula rosea TaxID=490093 RepID=A0A934VFE9_9BACT|nr:hypothetical protein [Haloferula rosea]MBK1826490.1 hypothetical protein [Haloferula rosea]
MTVTASTEVLRIRQLDGQLFQPFSCSIQAGTGAIVHGDDPHTFDEFIDLVGGLEPSLTGTIQLAGIGDPAADSGDWKARSRHIGYAAGDSGMISNLKVFENLLLPLQADGDPHARLAEEELENSILQAFDAAGFDAAWVHSRLRLSADGLSRFERVICGLVRCHLTGFRLLLGEQIFAELDPSQTGRLIHFLNWLGAMHPDSGILLTCLRNQHPDLSELSAWQPIQTLTLEPSS